MLPSMPDATLPESTPRTTHRKVVRQFTPLTYRVGNKDKEKEDRGKATLKPLVVSRDQDRQRHGGFEEKPTEARTLAFSTNELSPVVHPSGVSPQQGHIGHSASELLSPSTLSQAPTLGMHVGSPLMGGRPVLVSNQTPRFRFKDGTIAYAVQTPQRELSPHPAEISPNKVVSERKDFSPEPRIAIRSGSYVSFPAPAAQTCVSSEDAAKARASSPLASVRWTQAYINSTMRALSVQGVGGPLQHATAPPASDASIAAPAPLASSGCPRQARGDQGAVPEACDSAAPSGSPANRSRSEISPSVSIRRLEVQTSAAARPVAGECSAEAAVPKTTTVVRHGPYVVRKELSPAPSGRVVSKDLSPAPSARVVSKAETSASSGALPTSSVKDVSPPPTSRLVSNLSAPGQAGRVHRKSVTTVSQPALEGSPGITTRVVANAGSCAERLGSSPIATRRPGAPQDPTLRTYRSGSVIAPASGLQPATALQGRAQWLWGSDRLPQNGSVVTRSPATGSGAFTTTVAAGSMQRFSPRIVPAHPTLTALAGKGTPACSSESREARSQASTSNSQPKLACSSDGPAIVPGVSGATQSASVVQNPDSQSTVGETPKC